MHGRVATYTFTGDASALARKAEEGLLPIFQEQPGFQAYSIFTTGEKVISISAWDSAEDAEAANAAAAEWVADNMAGEITLQSADVCEIHVSTPLGITTTDRVSA